MTAPAKRYYFKIIHSLAGEMIKILTKYNGGNSRTHIYLYTSYLSYVWK